MIKRALSAAQVDALKKEGTHCVAPSLYLQVKANGARSWLLRYSKGGRTTWHGLGAVRDVGLKEARELAEDLRVAIRRGGDPVAEKRAAAPASVAPTFASCAVDYVAAHEASWKNDKHRAQWTSTLTTYANPVLGKLPVDKVSVDHVHKVLAPIWRTKPETASRLRGRIESVLGWATAKGFRTGENPAAWRGGALEHLLPPIGKVRKVKARQAVPYSELPELVGLIRKLDSVSARALLFTVLTAARTGETLGARWSEVDVGAKLWTIPADRMKAGREHRVPLTDEALALLGKRPRGDGFLFPGARPKRPLSNMALLQCLRGVRDDDGSTVHGLRASFRTWAAEATSHPREIVEQCLAHAVGSAVELAYQRSDHLAKRRVVMSEWASFVLRGES